MRTTHRLLGGEVVHLDVTDAAGLPGGTSIGVLELEGGGELELTSGREADLAFFLQVTGTTLDREVALRDGRTLRYGRFGGDPTQGFSFAIAVGDRHLYGFTLPTMDVETLTGYLADVTIESDDLGLWVVPGGRVAWSPYRTQTVAQVVELSGSLEGDGTGGTGYLLDVRRARTGQLQTGRAESGAQVRGGLLSRSSSEERHPYAVLESTDFVSYGLPGSDDQVDAVIGSMAELTVELGQ